MDILLLEHMEPEALAWLQERHGVVVRPELADDPAALRVALAHVQAVVLPRRVVANRELLQAAPALRAIGRLHVGSDTTDLEACKLRKVRVIQGTHAHVRSNAEYLLTSLLLLFRGGILASVRDGPDAPAVIGRELHGSIVGLLGLAPAAHGLAVMLQALGARLIGYDPAVHQSAPVWQRLRVQPVSLPELLACADAVSLQVPYASRFLGFVNDKALAHCKHGQFWASTSRSAIFDAGALAHALEDGRIAAAMLDGAEPGFAGPGSPLHGLPNLYLTPRLGALTHESRERASWYVAQRLHEALASTREGGMDVFLERQEARETQPGELTAPPSGP